MELGTIKIKAGEKKSGWIPVEGTEYKLPVTVVHGGDGPVTLITAGVHSAEYPGIQAAIELAEEITPKDINGTLIIVPVVNVSGIVRRCMSMVYEDNKNLNREFPGNPGGTPAQRLAAFLEQEFIERTDYLVDFHSGGFCEGLTPHLYFHGTAAPEVRAVSRRMAELTTVPYLVESSAENGFYSWAGQRGVPAILLERGKADEELLAREVSRRLSPGVPADLGAGWFEGLAGKNRYALIARLSLWRHLDDYLNTLDDEHFRRALVFLRRAFADFTPSEKNDIAENLGEIWGINQAQAAEVLMGDLSDSEQEVLSGLDEFDFDDI